MPQLLCRDAIRLLEASLQTYVLALHGISLPTFPTTKVLEARWAPVAGLLGGTVELATKACLVQAGGSAAILNAGGHYKFGSETTADFISMVKSEDPQLSFLWESHERPPLHRKAVLEVASRFKLLASVRAGGLHAGTAPSRDVILDLAESVHRFLGLLALARRVRPYLSDLPPPPQPIVRREALVEDLAARVRAAGSTDLQALRGLFLVLPELPEESPEWFEAFDRINLVPEKKDITYLLASLQSRVVTLVRGRGSQEQYPVRIEQNNPDAIPIATQFLRREFTSLRDQFHADFANANGRWTKSKSLDLPPDDSLLGMFVAEPETLPWAGTTLTAQQAWPSVASALAVQGTPRPFWFVAAQCDDLDQLGGELTSKAKHATKGATYLAKQIEPVVEAMRALANDAALPREHPLSTLALKYIAKASAFQQRLRDLVRRADTKGRNVPGDSLRRQILSIHNGDLNVGPVLLELVGSDRDPADENEGRPYWVGMLCQASAVYEDRHGLVAVLSTPDLHGKHTYAKKALQLIDLRTFGPDLG